MENEIRQQLLELTRQHDLDKSFVDRIMSAMEKPVANYTDEPVTEDETPLSTATVMEKGILTVISQFYDEGKAMVGDKSYNEIRSDETLYKKILPHKKQFDALNTCFWDAVTERLDKEGVANTDDIGIRTGFQIVQEPSNEMPAGISIIIGVGAQDSVRRFAPPEKLAKCSCPDCLAELARRNFEAGETENE